MSAAPQDLPEALRAVQGEVAATREATERFGTCEADWARRTAEARRRVPALRVCGGGEALYVGDLSPGCRACKEGTWDCVFLTNDCNLDCPFCCAFAVISIA